MSEVYYDAKNIGSYGGVGRFLSQSKGSKKWLNEQLTYQIHKPVKTKYPTRKYSLRDVDVQFQADLVDMTKYAKYNKGIKWMLTCIDLFSRYAWAYPLKSKSARDVLAVLKKIFAERRPSELFQTDEGKEFFNKPVGDYLKSLNIHHFAVKSKMKAAMVERWHRTLKRRMWRVFTKRGTYKWLDILPDLVDSYNRSKHSAIGMAPINVKPNNEKLKKLQYLKSPKNVKFKFQIGDSVRISKVKGIFAKGYEPNWSEEVFVVVTQKKTKPPMYKIRDYNGDVIDGSFYEAELQKIQEPTRYRVEKVIRTRINQGKKQYYVKWLGYPESANSWVDNVEKW